MKIRLLALASLMLLLPGCLVVRERRCGPDQYWDGYECRFKHRR